MPWRLIVDIVGFQLTWWAAVLGAVEGHWEPGVVVAAVVIAVQLAMARARKALTATVLAAAVIGFAGETALIASGLVSYAAAWPMIGLVPAWLIALWVVFATCIDATGRMLGANATPKAIVLGAIIAPPTYWAGERLGALTLAQPRWLAFAGIAAVWMIAMPLLLAAYARASR